MATITNYNRLKIIVDWPVHQLNERLGLLQPGATSSASFLEPYSNTEIITDHSPEPVVVGRQVTIKPTLTFFEALPKKTGSPVAKKVKHDRDNSSECHGSHGSEKLNRVSFYLYPSIQF